MGPELIKSYFPNLSPIQESQFEALGSLYTNWNQKINVVSRKDIDQLYLRHVLHSLSIAIALPFPSGSAILDVGTGGGFPGIPLAILFPDCKFCLCDSIAKKIKVVEDVIQQLGLSNVTAITARAESLPKGSFDFVVSRAVTRFADFIPWVKDKFRTLSSAETNPQRGIIYLKGGNLEQEIDDAARICRLNKSLIKEIPINNFLKEDFFDEKQIIFIPLQSLKN